MFGIRNLQKPRELSQPNQLDMVGERGFVECTPKLLPCHLLHYDFRVGIDMKNWPPYGSDGATHRAFTTLERWHWPSATLSPYPYCGARLLRSQHTAGIEGCTLLHSALRRNAEFRACGQSFQAVLKWGMDSGLVRALPTICSGPDTGSLPQRLALRDCAYLCDLRRT